MTPAPASVADRVEPWSARPLPSGWHSVLAGYANLIVRAAERWGACPEEILQHTGIAQRDLDEPRARLGLAPMIMLLDRARELSEEPGLGWYAGVQARISIFGCFGVGALSAGTLREAIEFAAAFGSLPSTLVTMRLVIEQGGARAALVLDENVDLGSARDFFLAAALTTVWSLVSRATFTGSAELMISEPPNYERIARAISPGRPVRFVGPANRVVFDAAALDRAMPTADPIAHRLARAQCAHALGPCGGPLVDGVRRMLTSGDAVRLSEVAGELRLSPRTMRRRLAERGLTFRAISEEARCERAMALLRAGVSVSEIAGRLGYSTPQAFARAFRSWTTLQPRAYRRQMG